MNRPVAGHAASVSSGLLAGMVLASLAIPAAALAQGRDAPMSLTVLTDGGDVVLDDARPAWGEPLDAGLAFFVEENGCLLLGPSEGSFLTGIPLNRAVSGARGANGVFRVLLDDGTVAKGTLRTGLRGRLGPTVPAGRVRGFNRRGARGSTPAAAPADAPIEIRDKSGCVVALGEVFVIDRHTSSAGGFTAYATEQVRLRRGDVILTAQWVSVSRLRPAAGPPGAYELWLMGPRPLAGSLELRTGPARGADPAGALGMPEAFDYLVGRRGALWYLLSFAELGEVRSLRPPARDVPAGSRLRIAGGEGDELVLSGGAADLEQAEPVEAVLASFGDLLLLRTATMRVGVHPTAVRSIRAADEGRVVLETRSGELFVGRLLTPIRSRFEGATVTLGPSLAPGRSVRFEGEWPDWKPTIVGNELRAEVRMRSGSRLPLNRVLLVDREGVRPGGGLRLAMTLELPVVDDGAPRALDLRRALLVEHLADGPWKVKMRDGELVQGRAYFRQPEADDPPGEPDELDFLIGHSEIARQAPLTGTEAGMAIHFVPLAEVSRIVLEQHANAHVPERNEP